MAAIRHHRLGQGGGQMMHLASGPADGDSISNSSSSNWNPRNDWLMQYTPSTTFGRFCQAVFAFSYLSNRQERDRCREEHKKMCRAIVEYNKQQGRVVDASRLAYLTRRIHCPWSKRFVHSRNCLCVDRDQRDDCSRCSGDFDMTLELGFNRHRLVPQPPKDPESARGVLQQIGTEIKTFNSHYRATSWLMRADSCAEPLPYAPWTAQFTADEPEPESEPEPAATTTVHKDDAGSTAPTFPAYVFLPLPSPSESTEPEPAKKKLKAEPASSVLPHTMTRVTPPLFYANVAQAEKTDSACAVP